MCTFLLQIGALWDMRLMHCGIHVAGLWDHNVWDITNQSFYSKTAIILATWSTLKVHLLVKMSAADSTNDKNNKNICKSYHIVYTTHACSYSLTCPWLLPGALSGLSWLYCPFNKVMCIASSWQSPGILATWILDLVGEGRKLKFCLEHITYIDEIYLILM